MNIFKKIKLFFVNEKSFLGFITVSLVLVIIGSIVYNLYKSGETLLDESVVSLAAFTMLIYTSFLQNKDLKLTRKELELTREEIKGTREEQAEQKNQMIKSNEMMKETMIQSRYFELLKIKEQTYSIIDMEDKSSSLEVFSREYKSFMKNIVLNNLSSDIKNYLSGNLHEKHPYYIPNSLSGFDKILSLEVDKLKNYINELSKGKDILEEMRKIYITKKRTEMPKLSRNQEKLFKTHKTIENLIVYIDIDNRPKGFAKQFIDFMFTTTKQFLETAKLSLGADPKVKEEYSLYELYKSTMLEEEKIFYRILDRKMTFNELFK